ncbi:MAG: AAA family ATPase [Myxococcales bacterium]|nr:AAA family ATPase [Myxococcales bacterium]
MDDDEFAGRVATAAQQDPNYKMNGARQSLNLARMPVGTLLVANRGKTEVLGLGRVTGPYRFVDGAEYCHEVPVDWFDTSARTVDRPGWARTLVSLDKSTYDDIVALPPLTIGGDGPGLPPLAPPRYERGHFLAETAFAEAEADRWFRILQDKKQIIVQGPPGTGKTWVAERLARWLVGGDDARVHLVQFHPAYSYEDFIQGIRPIAKGGAVSYELVPGRLVQLCQTMPRQGPVVLIIDEINRANLPRVFGELMYLLEYRDRTMALAGGSELGPAEPLHHRHDEHGRPFDRAPRSRAAAALLVLAVAAELRRAEGLRREALVGADRRPDRCAHRDQQGHRRPELRARHLLLHEGRPVRSAGGHLAVRDRAVPRGVLLRCAGHRGEVRLGQGREGRARRVGTAAMNVLALDEWQWTPLVGPDATSIVAAVRARHARQFEVAPPDPLSGTPWRLRSTGLVGFLPLGGDSAMALRIAPKVPITSILALIERAYDLESLRWHGGLDTATTIEGLFEVLVSLLCYRVGTRLRQGLYRAYVDERDELQVARGRVAPRETIARSLRGSVGLVCDFEELTDDLDDNRLLLWTLDRVRRVALGRADVRRSLREQHRTLSAAITLAPFAPSACVGRFYHRLNADYRPIHALCRAVLDACGAATEAGPLETIPFTVDMPRLFERFVARWLAMALPAWSVDAQHRISLDVDLSYPVDIVVRDRATGRPVAVIDTKYKDHDRPAPDDLQQVVFYATALGCPNAWLLYPRPVPPRSITVGPVRVRTLGLDLADITAWPMRRHARSGPSRTPADGRMISARGGARPPARSVLPACGHSSRNGAASNGPNGTQPPRITRTRREARPP